MRSKLFGIGLLGLSAIALCAAPAAADEVFQLTDATLQYGGDLTGTITFNNALTAVTAVDVMAPGPIAGSPGFTFEAMTYTDGSGFTVTSQLPSNSYVLDIDNGNGDSFQLTFASITAAGSTSFEQNSYEHQTNAGNRTVTAGSLTPEVSATPLPAALPLFAGGLGFVGFLAGRKKRKAEDTLAAA